MVVDARGICLRQRNTKAGRAERECFGGKLFFYKIEEVLVTSAGQCAGPRVHPSERAPWWAGISVPRLGNCSNIFAKLGPQDKLSSDWLRTDQWKHSKSNILSWSARLSVVTFGNCIWSVKWRPKNWPTKQVQLQVWLMEQDLSSGLFFALKTSCHFCSWSWATHWW